VAVHSPSERTGVETAGLRGRHPISLPDAYPLAAARQTGGEVVSLDRKVVRAAAGEAIPVAAANCD
jgi:predicted nucleic acid-binding protein